MSYINGQRFLGNKRVSVSAISGSIVMSRTTGQTPCVVMASASGISATGTSDPFGDLEYRWDFGDSSGTEMFTDPKTGRTLNANVRYGANASYIYRAAGTYTITLRVRGLDSGGAFITYSTTQAVTVTAFSASGGEYWIDSGAGSDANDGLDITRPKQTIAALNLLWASDCRYNLKRGSHWTEATGVSPPRFPYNRVRMQAYGTGADPIVEATSTVAFALDNGSSSLSCEKLDWVVSGINFYQSTGKNAGKISTLHATAQFRDTYFDNCTFEVTRGSGISCMSAQFSRDNADLMERFGLWQCRFLGEETDFSALKAITGLNYNKHGFFGGPHKWFAVFNNYFAGGGTSTTLDHHMYVETRDYAEYSYNHFGNGPGRSYALNLNVHTVRGEYIDEFATPKADLRANAPVVARWHYIGHNNVHGTGRFHDASRTNVGVGDCSFDYVVVEDNDIYDLTSDGSLLFFSPKNYTLRNNRIWHITGGRFFVPSIDAGDGYVLSARLKAKIYDNLIHADTSWNTGKLFSWSVAYDNPQFFTDNVIVDTRADARVMQCDWAGSSTAGDVRDYNTYYVPNDTTIIYDLGTLKTLAQFQTAGFETHSATTNPGWIDPANGVFDVPVGRVRFGAV